MTGHYDYQQGKTIYTLPYNVPVPVPTNPVYLDVVYTATTGGTINGEDFVTQFVAEGDDGTEVTATASPGYVFDRWSDGVLTRSRIDTNVWTDLSVTAIFVVSSGTEYSLWTPSDLPAVVDTGPDSAVALGVRFRSSVAGYVTGVKFYKAETNIGVHTACLWTNVGQLLATAVFNETTSGWQRVDFATPVAIDPFFTYVVSYHTTGGHYSLTPNYFDTASREVPPLTAPISASGFPNGCFSYGASSVFPNEGYNGGNYWVDVVFSTSVYTPPGGSSTVVYHETPPQPYSPCPLVIVRSDTGIGLVAARLATSTLAVEGDSGEIPCWIGARYAQRYHFSDWVIKAEGTNVGMLQGRLQIRNLTIACVDTGYFRLEVTPKNREKSVYPQPNLKLDSNALGEVPSVISGFTEVSITNDVVELSSESFRFPIFTRADDVEIELINDTHLPSTFYEASYEGTFTVRSKGV